MHFENHPSDDILKVRGLDLVLKLRVHEARTLRDAFVSWTKDPKGQLAQGKESLHVLQSISFSLKKGERVALLGVNGSGKTTLCRCIAGMYQPTKGEVNLQGECRALFDTQGGVIPELTGRENARLLAYFLYPRESDERILDIVEEATTFSELGSFLDAPYETYSLGMRARLFLSIVTARPADLLILDEVYDNTDQFFQRKMTERLTNFIHDSKAVLFVSHAPELVRKVCDRAIVLHESKIAYDGPVDKALRAYEFLHAPASQVPAATAPQTERLLEAP